MTSSGLLVVDKPAGLTSHDVVARLRRTLGTRKVGHAGTLDPMATGVLVVGFGHATRLLGYLLLADKTYAATVRLGQSTTTDDAEGEVVATASAAQLTETMVREALVAFTGEIQQVPSAVSAIKVGGKRAYARVREGEEVVLAPRTVTIHEIAAGDFRRTNDFLDLRLRVSCSTGTYIRAIARDLGAAFGVGGHLTSLRRTSVGPFTLESANTDLDHIFLADTLGQQARTLFPSVDVDDVTATAISHGRRLDLSLPAEGPVAMIGPSGDLLGLYERADPGAKAMVVFPQSE